MASNKRARATFEGQSSDRIAESDVAEETMSATVKLSKEIDEPDIGQPTAECQLMTPSERRLVTRCELRPVQGGEEDTEERVMTSHTETCESCEVTSVEEGHDVDGRNAPQSDETAGILKQLKDEMSADLTAFKKKELDRNTNHHDLTKAETEEIFVLTKAIGEKETVALKLEQSAKEVAQRPPPWRDKCNRGREFGVACTLVLGARGYKPRRVNKFDLFMPTVHNTSADELERYGLFKKSNCKCREAECVEP